jgi:hypothetical protein
MATLLARKSGPQDNAIAIDDEVHAQLVADPTVPQFGEFGDMNNGFNAPSTGSSAFGAPAAGSFGSPSSFGSSNAGFGPTAVNNFGGLQQQNQQQPVLTGAGSNAAQGADVLVQHDKDSTDWINKKWRPVMGWVYMMTCTADFVLFPILWSLLQALSKGNVTSQWQPLTLQGAGLYHIAMGAVLGIAAYGRTKEKIEGAAK